jgi:hypothetical protein
MSSSSIQFGPGASARREDIWSSVMVHRFHRAAQLSVPVSDAAQPFSGRQPYKPIS